MKSDNKKLNDPIFEMVFGSSLGRDSFVSATPSQKTPQGKEWYEDHREGQLAVDVFENDDEIVIVSTMAGAVTDKIEVYVHNDLLTIRGERHEPLEMEKATRYFHEECYWGKFSRTIVLPVDVQGDMAGAEYKNGILVVTIPKMHQKSTKIKIEVVEE
ncbi:MAG: hypothetical protein COX81_00560 [Candidatus Magasanikbacteria bacterium CG_4_10_14_0_2_um_filter_37_12]|uniref:SHSP domain-containing protein n=1 Tax=Candidatus Magasanikbacteria bacterium CG_4_10_14_0_2_um_filter_37_12 TaxID=1974637 RepID=A0A2M7V9U5_9BACT|nr:MAG: hypothetical protein COX81_00560 [Candidatus Magasanikbacteria bacterium CG_4_10_14_0_2_um_filter_37_12]